MSIPDDCLLEILKRLSPCSLVRFKCVSKPWCALIDSPEFIRMQLNQSRLYSKKYHEFLFNVNVAGQDYKREIWIIKTSENLQTNMEELNYLIPRKGMLMDPCGFVVGNCNGLVCIKGMENQLILWNPWIRKKSFQLPEIKYPVPENTYASDFRHGFFYGFGYTDITDHDDYKVKSLCKYHKASSLRSLTSHSYFEVHVYSMKKNSWRRLEDFKVDCVEDKDDYVGSHGVFASGALHFIVQKRGGDISIAAIDVKTEEYRLLSIPKDLTKLEYYFRRGFESGVFNVLDGCLCILPNSLLRGSISFSLGIMKDYGVEDSWTKFTVAVTMTIPIYFNIYPIEFSEGKMVLSLQVFGKRDLKLILYDIENQTLVQTMEVPPLACMPVIKRFVPKGYQCTPSIVPVPNHVVVQRR